MSCLTCDGEGSFSVEVDEVTQCLLAGRAELRNLVGAHAAVVAGAVNALHLIAAAFYEANAGLLANHFFPFALEVYLRGDVLLPRLYIEKDKLLSDIYDEIYPFEEYL